jgi:hypothetical protein
LSTYRVTDRDADRRAAEAMERQGDEASRSGGEAVNFYRQAQTTLLPTGVHWSDADEYEWRQAGFDRIQQKIWALGARPAAAPDPATPSEPCRTFLASTNVGYEQWHDGIGYDLDALAKATDIERRYVGDMLLQRVRSRDAGWRDIEALGALNLPEARPMLEKALATAKPETRLHIARMLAAQGVPVEIDRIIADILRRGSYQHGLSFALDLAPTYATPYLRDVLLDCARNGYPDVRVRAAALCLYLAGKADEPFDWKHRPFFLNFGEEDPVIRQRAFEELCRRIGRPLSGEKPPGNN